MHTIRPFRALALAALLAAPLASCSAPQAAEHMTVPAPESTLVAPDTIPAPAAPAAAKHARRHAVTVDRTMPLDPIAPENIGLATNPACLQLVAAEERLRIAQASYQDAMARFQGRAQARQDLAAGDGPTSTELVARDFPATAYREYVAASLAVHSLRDLCGDHR